MPELDRREESTVSTMNRCIYTYDPGRWPYLTRCWTPVVVGSSYCLRHQNVNVDERKRTLVAGKG